jgi:hypothetical protein
MKPIVPSGKLTVSYWKLPFIVDLPIKNSDFPVRYVRLPEGKLYSKTSSGFLLAAIFLQATSAGDADKINQ